MLNEKLISVAPEANVVSLISNSVLGDDVQHPSFKKLLDTQLGEGFETQNVKPSKVDGSDMQEKGQDVGVGESVDENNTLLGFVGIKDLSDVDVQESLPDTANYFNQEAEVNQLDDLGTLIKESNLQLIDSTLNEVSEKNVAASINIPNNAASILSLELAKIDGLKGLNVQGVGELEYSADENGVYLSKLSFSKDVFLRNGVEVVANSPSLERAGNSIPFTNLKAVSLVSESFQPVGDVSSIAAEKRFVVDLSSTKRMNVLGFESDIKNEKAQLQITGKVSKGLGMSGFSLAPQRLTQQSVESLNFNASMQFNLIEDSTHGIELDEFANQVSIKSDFTQSASSFNRDTSINLRTASINQLPKIVSSMVSNNQEALTVKLKPYELGAIEITVKEVAGEMTVTIRADRQSTVDALSQSESQLRDELDEKSSLNFSLSQHGSSESGESGQESFYTGSEVQEEHHQVIESGLLSIVI